MTLASAANSSGTKLVAILVAIFIFTLVARSLFTGIVLVRRGRMRVYRSEQPLVYWYHLACRSAFATLFLASVLFHVRFWAWLVFLGASWIGFVAVMSTDPQSAARRKMYRAQRRTAPRWAYVPTVLATLLALVGVISFIAPFIAVVGGLNWLPPSFEWPVGHAAGVTTMRNGYHVVLLDGAPRIQVYDPNWRFVRGWFFASRGEIFYLVPSRQDRIEAFSARHRARGNTGLHFVFTLNGDLISRGDYSLDDNTYHSIVNHATSVVVPTSIWLWPFSNPAHGWL